MLHLPHVAHFGGFLDANEFADGVRGEAWTLSEKTLLCRCYDCGLWMRSEAGMVVLRKLLLVVAFVDGRNLEINVG